MKPLSGAWRKAYEAPGRGGMHAFLTDGRGHSFAFHGSTKWKELDKLVDYLDRLEQAILATGGQTVLARVQGAHEAYRDSLMGRIR